jgi:hypothetical protein
MTSVRLLVRSTDYVDVGVRANKYAAPLPVTCSLVSQVKLVRASIPHAQLVKIEFLRDLVDASHNAIEFLNKEEVVPGAFVSVGDRASAIVHQPILDGQGHVMGMYAVVQFGTFISNKIETVKYELADADDSPITNGANVFYVVARTLVINQDAYVRLMPNDFRTRGGQSVKHRNMRGTSYVPRAMVAMGSVYRGTPAVTKVEPSTSSITTLSNPMIAEARGEMWYASRPFVSSEFDSDVLLGKLSASGTTSMFYATTGNLDEIETTLTLPSTVPLDARPHATLELSDTSHRVLFKTDGRNIHAFPALSELEVVIFNQFGIPYIPRMHYESGTLIYDPHEFEVIVECEREERIIETMRGFKEPFKGVSSYTPADL